METLIIISCVIVYLIMWFVTGVIARRADVDLDSDFTEAIGLFWPITLPVIGMRILIDYTDWWLDHKEDEK